MLPENINDELIELVQNFMQQYAAETEYVTERIRSELIDIGYDDVADIIGITIMVKNAIERWRFCDFDSNEIVKERSARRGIEDYFNE